jgi:hypothetical protein
MSVEQMAPWLAIGGGGGVLYLRGVVRWGMRGIMGKSGVNRVVAVVATVLVATGAAMVTAGTAWSAPRHHPVPPKIRSAHSVLRVDAAAGMVELTIPTPPCPPSNEHCEWMLIITEPKVPGNPVVGSVTGRLGVLALTFPNFCGVIQADSLVGPAPWTRTHGVRRQINTCVTPTTTTTTKPAVISTTTTTKPPVVSAATTTPTTSALPFTMATSASPTTTPAHVTAATTAAAAQLPFTGLNLKPLVLLGSTLILLGGMLLTTVESRRRALQRAAAIRLDDVREGTRKASSWFLGL